MDDIDGYDKSSNSSTESELSFNDDLTNMTSVSGLTIIADEVKKRKEFSKEEFEKEFQKLREKKGKDSKTSNYSLESLEDESDSDDEESRKSDAFEDDTFKGSAKDEAAEKLKLLRQMRTIEEKYNIKLGNFNMKSDIKEMKCVISHINQVRGRKDTVKIAQVVLGFGLNKFSGLNKKYKIIGDLDIGNFSHVNDSEEIRDILGDIYDKYAGNTEDGFIIPPELKLIFALAFGSGLKLFADSYMGNASSDKMKKIRDIAKNSGEGELNVDKELEMINNASPAPVQVPVIQDNTQLLEMMSSMNRNIQGQFREMNNNVNSQINEMRTQIKNIEISRSRSREPTESSVGYDFKVSFDSVGSTASSKKRKNSLTKSNIIDISSYY